MIMDETSVGTLSNDASAPSRGESQMTGESESAREKSRRHIKDEAAEVKERWPRAA